MRLIAPYYYYKATLMFTIINAVCNYFLTKSLPSVKRRWRIRSVDFSQPMGTDRIKAVLRKAETKLKIVILNRI